MCAWKSRPALTVAAFWSDSAISDSGKLAGSGIAALSTSTGQTRIPCSNAFSSSIRTGSAGFWMRILAFGIAQPFGPYDHQHDIRIAQGTGDVISKIDADRNAVDIHKDRVLTVRADQPISDATRNSLRIATTI